MAEVSNFRAIKTNFTFSEVWLVRLQCWHAWFWDLVVLLLLCRPRFELKSCRLFWYGDCGQFCAFRLLLFKFWRFCPLSLRGDSNRTDLVCCSCLRSLELYLCPYLCRESSRLCCRLRDGMYVFRLSRVSFSYLLLVFSRESCWLLLSMELFLSHSLLRELSRDPLLWLYGMLSVSLWSDWTNSSKMAVFSVKEWFVIWFTPAELLLAVPIGFRPSNSRYASNSSAFVKAWSAFSGFNFLNSHLRVELFKPSIKLVTTICSSKCGWSRF